MKFHCMMHPSFTNIFFDFLRTCIPRQTCLLGLCPYLLLDIHFVYMTTSALTTITFDENPVHGNIYVLCLLYSSTFCMHIDQGNHNKIQ